MEELEYLNGLARGRPSAHLPHVRPSTLPVAGCGVRPLPPMESASLRDLLSTKRHNQTPIRQGLSN